MGWGERRVLETLSRARADCDHGDPRRRGEGLLRSGRHRIVTPLVHAKLARAHATDGVDERDRAMIAQHRRKRGHVVGNAG